MMTREPVNAHTSRRFQIKLHNLLIVLALTLAGIALLITATVFYSDTQALISEKLDAIHEADFNRIEAEIIDFYESSGKVATLLQNNKQLIAMIQESEYEEIDLYRKSELVDEINGYLTNLTVYNKAIRSINIVTHNAQYYSKQLLFNQQLTDKFSARKVDGVAFEYPKQFADTPELSQHQDVLLNSQKLDMDKESYYITSLQAGEDYYGNVVVMLRNLPLISEINKKNDIMIVDGHGQTIFRGQSFGNMDVDSLYEQTIRFNNWKVYYRIDNKAYRNQASLLFALAIGSFLVCFLISFLFAKFITRHIVRPITNLASYIQRYKVGDAAVARAVQLTRPKQMSLREKIFYYFLLSILVPVGGFVLMFHLLSSSMLSEQIVMDYENVFENTASSLNDYMEQKEKLMLGQAYGTLIQGYLQGNPVSEISIYDQIEQYMFLGMNGTLSLYDASNRLLLSSRFRPKQQMDAADFHTLQNSRQKLIWSRDRDSLGTEMIKLGLNITDLLHLKTIGYAQMEIRLDEIAKLYAQLSIGSDSAFLFDRDGIVEGNHQLNRLIVSHLDGRSGLKPVLWQETTYYMFYRQIGATSFYLISLYNKQDVVKQSGVVLMNNIYLLIVLLLTLLILSFSISWTLLSPVYKINNSLHVADLAQLKKIPPHHYAIDEVYELADNFNQLLGRIEDLIDDVLVVNKKKQEVEISKNAADIRALQAQINPHFLQNTLDNTIYMIQEGHEPKAIRMIQSLSRLFRYGISRGETIIPLHEEIKYAKAYVSIMEMRYGDGIQIEWNIEEAMLKYNTLKLILQPLIENAIHHGFLEYQGNGMISIACMESDGQILITVADNGKGISEEDLEGLQNRLLTGEPNESIGLLNVQERIRLSFGEPFGVTIKSEQNKYTKVTVTLPKLLKEQA